MSVTIKKGEDKTLVCTIKIDDLPANVTGWTIQAALKDRSKTDSTVNGPTIACADSGGADFSAGVIHVPYSVTDTNAMTAGEGFELEIDGNDGSGTTKKWISEELVDILSTVIT